MDSITFLAPASPRQRLRQLEGIVDVRDWPHAVGAVLHVLALGACLWTWLHGLWPLSVFLWTVIVWLDHAALARLHEAVHRMLSRSRVRNELGGIVIGTLALTPMSVYRSVHARHHSHLCGLEDPEFYPYNQPDSPRRVRLIYAWTELLAGWIVTPALYSLRTARAWEAHDRPLRRRLVGEWLLLVVFWGSVLAVVARQGWWEHLVVAHVVPSWIAGSLQTVRKFTEHMGLTGESIFERTRTVVYRGGIGRLASASQLHVDHHATHHRHPRIPWFHLPAATAIALEAGRPARVYPSHLAALRDALRGMGDPMVGPQWRVQSVRCKQKEPHGVS